MAISTIQLQRLLSSDEPNYTALARFGPKILPYLDQFVRGPDSDLAAKAASLAGMINHDDAVRVLQRAAKSPSATVRLAAASAALNLQRPAVSGVLVTLLGDRDPGVRKFAIKSAATRQNPALIARMRSLSEKDPVPSNRMLAKNIISKKGTVLG
ncbi:HEAT repeat-containing protein [Nitrosospira briensis]|uniref:HEAT repeat-containing protein n=1 Tax=Nitrosospira briensis TaxID=35799 RepID=A0A1I5DGX1_9PROT|nr:HEAT repeat domain-containing protein [Nitrosospira briensis]SFN98430.1 HEAT repeat-containing protein [Nitrosospira briensis]